MLGVVLMDFIRSGRKYLTKLGTTAQAVIKANPECLQPSEQLAPKVGSETGRGLDPVMHPCSGIMKSHRQPSLRTIVFGAPMSNLLEIRWSARVSGVPSCRPAGVCGQKDAVWVSQAQTCRSFST